MPKMSFEVSLPVAIFKERETFVAYTPALDLSTSADTFEKVKKRFNEAVQIFFEETAKKGTLEDILQESGWKKIEKSWSPPLLIAHEAEKFKIAV